MDYALSTPALQLAYDDKFREYALSEVGDGSGGIVFTFCPFCGARLPASVRQEWFEYFFQRDLDPDEDQVPPAMRTGQWWREAGM